MHAVVSAGGPLMPFARMADIDEGALDRFFAEDAMGTLRLFRRGVAAMRGTGPRTPGSRSMPRASVSLTSLG